MVSMVNSVVNTEHPSGSTVKGNGEVTVLVYSQGIYGSMELFCMAIIRYWLEVTELLNFW